MATVESPTQLRRWLAQLVQHANGSVQSQPLNRPRGGRLASLGHDQRIIVVSNRVSLPRAAKANDGGLAVSMSAVLNEHGGVWIGWSGKINETPHLQTIPHGEVTYLLQDITSLEYEHFYMKFCNAILWPLLHYTMELPEHIRPAYETYLEVNARYAELVISALRPGDVIWVHDFHFIPLAAELRRRGVKNRIGFFLHVPFPSREVLMTLPVHYELMSTLGAYDVIGFQTQRDLEAFRDYAASESIPLGANEELSYPATFAGHFPISIDTPRFARQSKKSVESKDAQELKASLEGRALILGVDRMDYSKGLIQRLRAIDELLTRQPEFRKQFTFLQIAPPTREDIQKYAALRAEVEALVGHINGKHAMVDWVPIRFLARGIRRETIAAFYRLARVCLVTPLRDGMNLVAKEYVAAQDPEDPGVLILSRFAGASEELQRALQVNPHDTEEMSNAIAQALAMPKEERRERWRNMYTILSKQTLESWYQDYLHALSGAS
ncbi:MAG: trehalose-6-phosphate synthase [Alphaproteobacteria bacterium]|nr:trehalose-6-phosphate synthase [Alphaproteobacteria bacterium]